MDPTSPGDQDPRDPSPDPPAEGYRSLHAPKDRRAQPRREVALEACLLTAEARLEGATINMSPNGALVRARGFIEILLEYGGRQYRGRLVRMAPHDRSTGSYAMYLVDPIED